MDSESLYFKDNTETYKDLIPRDLKDDLSLYKNILHNLGELQKKLEKNLYRVNDIERLKNVVFQGRLRVGKYSIIEEKEGNYNLVKFSDFFFTEFEVIRKLLEKLSSRQEKSLYKNYIDALVLAYTNNNFIEPYKQWVYLNGDNATDFIAFPTEPYLDREFETMLSFDGSLRILAEKENRVEEEKFKNQMAKVISNLPKLSELHLSLDLHKIRSRIDYTLIEAAATPIFDFRGQNLPNERDFVLQWGSKVIIYKSHISRQIEDTFYPVASAVLNSLPLEKSELEEGIVKKVLVHEIIESLMKFEGSEERLGNMFLRTRELNSDMSGITNYVLALLKDERAASAIRALAYAYIASCLHFYRDYVNKEGRTQHFYGYVAAFNYFLENGTVKILENNKLEIDPKSILKDISALSKVTTHLMLQGTKEEAKEFFDKYSDESKIKRVLNEFTQV